jgi:hypothetical protein
MRLTQFANIGVALSLMTWIGSCPASAEIKPSEFAGEWSGSGTDRDSPLESLQKTSCRSKVRSEGNRMSNEIVCSGQSGVRKTIQLQITMNGNQITGDLVQTTATQPPTVRKGSVSGHSAGDAADMQINFSGFMMPSGTAKLVVLNQSSYSIKVTAMGASLMDVTFKKVGQPAHASQAGQ